LTTPAHPPPSRLQGLERRKIGGIDYPAATTLAARLLGLALLERSEAGPGLLIPRCSSVHSFGMRFALDVVFLDAKGVEIARRTALPARRFATDRRAVAVLELPSAPVS